MKIIFCCKHFELLYESKFFILDMNEGRFLIELSNGGVFYLSYCPECGKQIVVEKGK